MVSRNFHASTYVFRFWFADIDWSRDVDLILVSFLFMTMSIDTMITETFSKLKIKTLLLGKDVHQHNECVRSFNQEGFYKETDQEKHVRMNNLWLRGTLINIWYRHSPKLIFTTSVHSWRRRHITESCTLCIFVCLRKREKLDIFIQPEGKTTVHLNLQLSIIIIAGQP